MRAVLLVATLLAGEPAPERLGANDEARFGFALGLYPREAAEREWDYPPELSEVAGLGAQSILLTPTWSQRTVHSSRLAPDEETPPDEDFEFVIERARAAGMSVTMMPYLRIQQGGPGAWRGTIDPADQDAWWASYEAFLVHYARMAEEKGVRLFAIGSELTSLSGASFAWRWRVLARRIRAATSGQLAFVLNHDALDLTAPLAFVDVAGVSAYFPCGDDPAADWRGHAATLREFARQANKPLVLFELGFPSRRGGLERPWDHVAGTPVDVEAQAAGYAAATEALAGADWLSGVYFWAWYGEGGRYDRGYSPHGKPAESIARRFLLAVPTEARAARAMGYDRFPR